MVLVTRRPIGVQLYSPYRKPVVVSIDESGLARFRFCLMEAGWQATIAASSIGHVVSMAQFQNGVDGVDGVDGVEGVDGSRAHIDGNLN